MDWRHNRDAGNARAASYLRARGGQNVSGVRARRCSGRNCNSIRRNSSWQARWCCCISASSSTRKLGHYQRNSRLEFVLEIFWGLWLVMPMLVGAAAVAEERKLGTLAGQFCLPVKRRTQFAVKFRVVMLLSILFGVVMPLLLEGSRILPDIHQITNPVMHHGIQSVV